MEGTSQFYVHTGLIVVRNILRIVHRHSCDECLFPPALLAWEAFWKATLIASWVASEASKVLMVKSRMSGRDAIRSTPDTSPPRLGGRTRSDEYGACVGKGQIKSNQERKALV